MRDEGVIHTTSLIRDILNALWIIIGIYIIATSVDAFFTTKNTWLFVQRVIFYPSIFMIITIGIIEICLRKIKNHLEYILILGINIIASAIILTLYEKPILIFLLIFPVMVSLYFYKSKLLKFACITGILSGVFIYVFSEQVRAHFKHSDLIIMIAVIFGTSLLINSLMKHSHRLANDLLQTTKEKQYLFSQNIQMEKLTRMDPVTELYNHRSFHEYLETLLKMELIDELEVHIAILDIDNFKKINDTYGHQMGDLVIVEVAKQIKSFMDNDDFAFRYGGEEFAIINIGLTTEEFLEKMENIRLGISSVCMEELEGNCVTISAGIQKLLPAMSKDILFNGADTSLYIAKKSGKNKVIVNSVQQAVVGAY
ncbi:GGDEF domain-containing protein [Lederbergia wuyishanensis]|uniref:Diguanylate cyclase (GGDEF)-like protein n=1 Tax=Lederbergia wuyishanensis TaxID=1347903 RepID=A0ABU0D632_9BACI|nr:GGDEF domain-containing protein [Lederbergia wuyishanensis]MCJ8008734.1 GGDEF domain-containing protein [Lederbergia wuyishanensis]MDQ0343845.1 diguanylate cyclase (GGDEF)-like protein [Lederbergia wuyishanensis]